MADRTEVQDLKNRLVAKLLRHVAVGANYVDRKTIRAWVPTRQVEAFKVALDELSNSEDGPIKKGPHRAVQLTSIDDAVTYLENNNGDVPFGFNTKDQTGDDVETEFSDDRSELIKEVRLLKGEIESMNEAASDWREAAERRQKLSLLLGVIGFIGGLLTSIVI